MPAPPPPQGLACRSLSAPLSPSNKGVTSLASPGPRLRVAEVGEGTGLASSKGP